MGRQKTPTKILELRGSWRANEREGTMEVPASVPEPVFPLGTVARQEWDRLVGLLESARVLGDVDAAALTALCQKWGEYVDLINRVNKEGVVITDERGKRYRNPAAIQADSDFAAWERLMKQFGLTPSSRAGVQVGSEKPKGQSKEAKHFGT